MKKLNYPYISWATSPFCHNLLFSHWQFLGDKKIVLQTTFSFPLFFKENKLKRFLWHRPVLRHCIIKGLFCINRLQCENECKERHGINSGSFLKIIFAFVYNSQFLVATWGTVPCRKLRTKAEVLNKIFHETCSCCLLAEISLCFHSCMKAEFS